MSAEPVAGQSSSKSLFVMVGDMSADKHAARILTKLQELAPDLKVWGAGGPEMVAHGFEQVYNLADFAGVGTIGSLKKIPFFARSRSAMVKEISKRKPQAVLLVDFGGYNLPLASELRKRFPELPILYFISPQVWASRPWRIKEIARTVKKMLVIFPFEETLYREKGIDAHFVGHPLTDDLPDPEQILTRDEFCQSLDLAPQRKIVSVFPGSRKSEVRDLLPVMLQSIDCILETRNDVQFVISQANLLVRERVTDLIASYPFKTPGASAYVRAADPARSYELMKNADLVWAKSGTTTLEVTLFGKPMLVLYRVDWPTWLIALNFMLLRRVSWPNLLYGGDLVPELIQLDCRAEQIVRYTSDLLDVPALRDEISKSLLALRNQLGQGEYASKCAREILQTIEQASQATRYQPQAKV